MNESGKAGAINSISMVPATGLSMVQEDGWKYKAEVVDGVIREQSLSLIHI